MPRIRRESGPRGVVHVTIPNDKTRESGWQVGDDVTFDWDGKRMILTKLPKQLPVSKAPAETGIPATEKSTEESTDKATARYAMSLVEQQKRLEEVVKTAAAPVVKEDQRPLGTQQNRICPVCDSGITSVETRCHACGANLSVATAERAWLRSQRQSANSPPRDYDGT
jgi:hypothetical protein